MAKWNTFVWSDGTKWADANGTSGFYTAFIDRSGYRVSVAITQSESPPPGSLAGLVIQTVSAELGPRPQLPSNWEAFIDRTETTNRISVVIQHVGNPNDTLLTEAGEELLQENGDNLYRDPRQPFQINKIHGLIVQRSRQQPTS